MVPVVPVWCQYGASIIPVVTVWYQFSGASLVPASTSGASLPVWYQFTASDQCTYVSGLSYASSPAHLVVTVFENCVGQA
jgi:hypothetical protein